LSSATTFELHVRSYAVDTGHVRHAFAQLVLPLHGALAVDIEGRQRELDAATAAFIEPGAAHSTLGLRADRSLILDLDAAMLGDDVAGADLIGALAQRRFLQRNEAASRLVDYMQRVVDGGRDPATLLPMWVPLLLDSLAATPVRPTSRLQALLACLEAEPGLPWTTATMAARAALSVSRLHALFDVELQTSPRAWLAGVRLRHARELLARTALPIAEIAQRCGYADQSALTHAMRRIDGITPAALRRAAQESATADR
jgi:transcriptional regulator GlxA family with amidase domain